MELLLFIIGACALGAFAMRFGRDSRDLGLRSEEHRLAEYGMRWSGTPRYQYLPIRPSENGSRSAGPSRRSRPTRRRAHALRHPIAVALYRIAHWLAPEMTRATG
jgi:hypothetical protein